MDDDSMFFQSPNGQRSVSYLFIDAASIAFAYEEFANRYMDGAKIVLNWTSIIGANRKAFVYDAIPVQREDEDDNTYNGRVAPKREELAAIERQRGYQVRAGDVRHRRKRGNEQKMVDIMLAVDALQMAGRGLFDTINLWTSDLDFKPLVTALVDMGVDVHLTYPEKVTSEELVSAADAAWALTPQFALQWIDQRFTEVFVPVIREGASSAANASSRGLIAEWDGRPFGRCQIYSLGPQFQLVAEQNTGGITEIIAPSMGSLRNLASDLFDLSFPEAIPL